MENSFYSHSNNPNCKLIQTIINLMQFQNSNKFNNTYSNELYIIYHYDSWYIYVGIGKKRARLSLFMFLYSFLIKTLQFVILSASLNTFQYDKQMK